MDFDKMLANAVDRVEFKKQNTEEQAVSPRMEGVYIVIFDNFSITASRSKDEVLVFFHLGKPPEDGMGFYFMSVPLVEFLGLSDVSDLFPTLPRMKTYLEIPKTTYDHALANGATRKDVFDAWGFSKSTIYGARFKLSTTKKAIGGDTTFSLIGPAKHLEPIVLNHIKERKS